MLQWAMAKLILVANWKNHPSSLSEARFLLKNLSKKRLLYKKLALFIAPPLPYMEEAATRTSGFAQLACQNIFKYEKATFTGEVGVDILKSFGVRLAILGHSEQRALGETAEMVKEKVKLALKANISPLICFGEKERDTDGEHFELLRQELKLIVGNLSKREASKIALAYEPAWAIGKSAKDALDPTELMQTVIFVRKILTDFFGRRVAESVPILYGGSVEPANAPLLMKAGGVRGFLVGHASLSGKSFEGIAKAVLEK